MNKLVYCAILAGFLTGCANSNQQQQPTAWNMTWSCEGNGNCCADYGSCSGNGSFTSEDNCIAWETWFINYWRLPAYSVTACTAN